MADNNVRIRLELVEGAAQKALADFAKQSSATDKAIGSLNRTADAGQRSFSAFANTIANDFGDKGSAAVGGFADLLNGPMLLALGAVAAAGVFAGKALDFTIATERNSQIANSFDAIAASAGLAGDSLKSGLLAATQGLADDDAILEAANKAIIELGTNADKIPEIMEIARKSTALFGGDLLQNFENVSSAIASGNTKSLRNIGLIVDTDAAQKVYAQTLGLTADQLSEAGKKQAIQNAALELAKEKFKDVDESSVRATLALQRFKTSAGEVADTIAKITSNSSAWGSLFNALGSAAETFARNLNIKFGTGIEQLDAKLAKAKSSVDFYSESVADLEGRLANSNAFTRGGISAALEETKSKLTLAKVEVDDLTKAIGRLSSTKVISPISSDTSKSVNTETILKARTEAMKQASEAELSILQTSAEREIEILRSKLLAKQITQQEFDLQNAAISEAQFSAKMAIEADRFMQENEQLVQKFDGALSAESGYFAQRDLLATQFAARVSKIDLEAIKAKNRNAQSEDEIDRQRVANRKETLSTISTLATSNNNTLANIGKAAGLAQIAIDTPVAIAKALAAFPPPFNFAAASAVGAAMAVQSAQLAGLSFEQGGIVPGNSYTGDKIQANVNSAEMILNRSQQAELFKLANGGGAGSDLSRTNQLLEALLARDESIVVQIGGKTVVETLRSEIAKGLRFE